MRAQDAVVIALAVLAVATVAGTVSATGNTAPLADAGPDQRVTPNATVYLDANESRDPDGELASVAWTVEPPDGDTRSPDCGSCRQTEFEVNDTGQYNVTLSVTDDDGATRSDTLYVTVAADDGPSVTLSGPAVTSRNSDTEVTAMVESPDTDLQSLAWIVDGDVVDQQELDGTNATVSRTHSFDETGDASIRAVAYDTLGYRGADERTITVGTPARGGGGGGGNSNCGPNEGAFYQEGEGDICFDGVDRLVTVDGETYVQDVNGEDGIQLYDDDGNLVDLGDAQDNGHINSDGKLIDYGGGDIVAHVAAGNDAVPNPNKKEERESDGGDGGSRSRSSQVQSNYDSGSSAQCYTCQSDDTDSGATSSADLAGTISSGSSNDGGDPGGSNGSGGGGIVDTVTNFFDGDSGSDNDSDGGGGGGGGFGGYLSGII